MESVLPGGLGGALGGGGLGLPSPSTGAPDAPMVPPVGEGFGIPSF